MKKVWWWEIYETQHLLEKYMKLTIYLAYLVCCFLCKPLLTYSYSMLKIIARPEKKPFMMYRWWKSFSKINHCLAPNKRSFLMY